MSEVDPSAPVGIDPPAFWGTPIFNPAAFDKLVEAIREAMEALGVTNTTSFGTDRFRPNVYSGVFLDPRGIDGDGNFKFMTVWNMQTMPSATGWVNVVAPGAGTHIGQLPDAPEGA